MRPVNNSVASLASVSECLNLLLGELRLLLRWIVLLGHSRHLLITHLAHQWIMRITILSLALRIKLNFNGLCRCFPLLPITQIQIASLWFRLLVFSNFLGFLVTVEMDGQSFFFSNLFDKQLIGNTFNQKLCPFLFHTLEYVGIVPNNGDQLILVNGHNLWLIFQALDSTATEFDTSL